jgi:putative zinc finger protein
MNGNGSQHPARSVEFLSRLHDGDLDASERARFEAHRSHCTECRRAALEFEDAISLFRSSRSTPPRADLAARILHKIQSTNRPRTPFSPRFRFDLAGAALLVTALLALLIATPIVVRRTPPPLSPIPTPASPPPVDASLRDMARQPQSAAKDSETRSRDQGAVSPGAVSGRLAARTTSALSKKKEERQEAADAPPVRENEAKVADRSAAAPLEADERRDKLSRVVAAAEAPVAAAGGSEEPPASNVRAVPLRLTVHSIDGYGPAPALLPEPSITLPPQERGREYVLLLDSQGVVREVRPSPAPAALSHLHFRPGSRPRRLLVRLE